MTIVYKIHPAIGIARVGDSEDYYLGPETAGGLPIEPDGGAFGPDSFRDANGCMRRQAARFRVFQYDSARADNVGTEVLAGQDGVIAIRWRVHVANKKAIWYQFQTVLGENGYAPDHPLRNAAVTDPDARRAMIIDPGPRQLCGGNQSASFSRDSDADGYPMSWPPTGLKPKSIDSLGQIHTDAQGRLIFVGGYGHSGSSVAPMIFDYANNDDWWDDTSDGPVTAVVIRAGANGEHIEEVVQFPAWVAVAPPGYAPQILNLVTLYDTMHDVAVRSFGARPDMYRDQQWQSEFKPSFASDIAPILRRGRDYPWVAAIPPHAHQFDFGRLGDPDPAYRSLRQFILSVLRPRSAVQSFSASSTGLTMMPFLAGDNAFYEGAPASAYLTLTDTQYFLLQQWADGKFESGASTAVGPGAVLDQAVLENCVGGAFSPGIEMTWITRNPLIYQEPYRLKHRAEVPTPLSLTSNLADGLEPGDGCKYMACPWQADFNECSSQPIVQPRANTGNPVDGNQVVARVLWWWPAQRPGFVWTRDADAPLGRRQHPWVGSSDPNSDSYISFADDLSMVERWHELGFVYNFGSEDQPEFLLTQDRLNRPDTA